MIHFAIILLSLFFLLPTQRACADAADISIEETTVTPASTETFETPSETLSQIEQTTKETPVATPVSEKTFSPFAGKIVKNRVRMRLNPSLEAPILRELKANDLVVVVGENDDFYAVEPPSDLKGYIYRAYVLDGTIEGNRVNVRLEPDTNSLIIGQMNAGEKVNGMVSTKDKKWIEIAPPASARFYISKEYVQNAGDPSIIVMLNNRKNEVDTLLNSAILESQDELKKPISLMNLDHVTQTLSKIITQYSDFPEQAAQAKDLLTSIQTTYMNKKLTDTTVTTDNENVVKSAVKEPLVTKSTSWTPVEEQLFTTWNEQNGNQFTMEDFYTSQEDKLSTLSGMVEPYNRNVKNKPGDYLLVNPKTHLPIAYLYSTKVNLQEKVGKEVTIKAISRDNHHFAYPAYFVLSSN